MLVSMVSTTFNWNHGPAMTIEYDEDTQLPIARVITKDTLGRIVGKINLCVTHNANPNLDKAQKTLLEWHCRLGHMGLQWIQYLDKKELLPKIILKADIKNLKCAACALGRAKKRSSGRHRTKHSDGNQSIKKDDLKP